ncbi:hypothetical protein [Deinococcus altitudinis]|uniref:hypothetical protein n=1 Tax=Deinococcus altitudinis TaxID=468914 RepID=UPI003892B2ED
MLSFARLGTSSTRRWYLVAVSLFALLFVGSAVLTLVDTAGAYEEYRHLEFPTWLQYPQRLAKLLGVAAVLFSRSRVLKDFAFAGFLYNLLLALGALIAQHDSNIYRPLAGLALWCFAFVMDRRVNLPEPSLQLSAR